MKQRFSSLDVRVCFLVTSADFAHTHMIQVITRELASEIVNLRVSNIYDLSSVSQSISTIVYYRTSAD